MNADIAHIDPDRRQPATGASASNKAIAIPVGFPTMLPDSEDPVELALREQLGSEEPQCRAEAALRLGARHLHDHPRVARMLLRQAAAGSCGLTTVRAHLRLAYLAHAGGDRADASAFLEQARSDLIPRGLDEPTPLLDRLAVGVDVATAHGLMGQRDDAMGMLEHIGGHLDALARRAEGRLELIDTDDRRRSLQALVALRTGQVQLDLDRTAAAVPLRRATVIGQGSVLATAALLLGRLLQQIGGHGADIEELFRRAAEVGDPVASPQAQLELGELLSSSARHADARACWQEALETGDSSCRADAEARLGRPMAISPGARAVFEPDLPVPGVAPPTSLGRVASGRAADDDGRHPRRVVIVGAGTGGRYLLPGLLHRYEIVGFVDDAPHVRTVEAWPVLGRIEDIEEVLLREQRNGRTVEQVIFAIPTAPASLRLRVMQATHRLNVPLVSLPSMFELHRGRPLVPQLRPIAAHETFGEDAWVVDREAAALVRARRVAITGAGSVIGAELARRVAQGHARHLLLIDENPGPLLQIAAELRDARDYVDCDARIADLADTWEMKAAFDEYQPDIVLHCGGVNHAPAHVLPVAHALRANVQAARNVAEAARRVHCERLVLASSDRAGHRHSPFDRTKALAEAAVLENAEDAAADANAHPLGDVAAGAGMRVHVLRLPSVWTRDWATAGGLLAQLKAGGPIHASRSMRRTFLFDWQAAQAMLRLLAPEIPTGIWACSAGETVDRRQFAERLVLANGLVAGRDIEIKDTDEPATKSSLALWGQDEQPTGEELPDGTREIRQEPWLVEELTSRLKKLKSDQHGAHVEDDILAELVRPSQQPPVARTA